MSASSTVALTQDQTELAGHRSPSPLPTEIRDILERMLHRARMLTLAKGAAVSIAVFIGFALVVMGVDLIVPIWDWRIRLALTLSALIASVAILIWQVLLPVLRPIRWADLARQIDSAEEGLQERLSSAVEFLVSKDPETLKGSPQLILRVVGEASWAAPRVELKKVVKAERAKRVWVVAGGMIVLVAGLAALWPDFRTLAVRFALPTSSLARVSLTRVRVEPQPKEGETAVLAVAGEPLQIRATVTGRPARSATLLLDWGNRQEEMMLSVSPEDPTTFLGTLSAVPSDGHFEVRANDGNSGQVAIHAVPRPRVQNAALQITPPEYTGEKAKTVVLTGEPIDLLAGTRVELLVQANKAVEKAKVQFSDNDLLSLFEKPEAEAAANENKPKDGSKQYTVRFTPKVSTSFQVVLQDQYGFQSPTSGVQTLLVRPDVPPMVQITAPKGPVTLRPTDKLPIQFIARDDLGLDKIEVVYRVEETSPRAQPAMTAAQIASKTAISGAAVLDLAAVKVGQAKVVRYLVRAYDRRPANLGGPGTGDSAEQIILIDASADPFSIQMLGSLRERIRQAIAAIDADLKKADEVVEGAQKRADQQPVSGEESAVASSKLLAADKGLRDLADLVAGSEYLNFGIRAKEIAEQPVASAMQKLTEATTASPDPKPRKQNLTESDFHIDRARAQLAELAKQIDDVLAYQKSAKEAQENAQKQTELMEKMAKLEQESAQGQKPTKEQMAQLTEEQKKLVEETQQILSAHPELGREALSTEAKKEQKILQEQIADLAKAQSKLSEVSAQAAKRDEQARKLDELKGKNDDQSQKEAQKLGARLAKENEQRNKEQLAKLAEAQNQIANEAGELNDKLAQLNAKKQEGKPAEAPPVAPAAAAAAQAVPQINAGKLPEAAKEMTQAAKGLQDFAQSVPQQQKPSAMMSDAQQAGTAAAQEAELRDQAQELAKREQALVEQALALSENKPEQALASEQAELARESQEIGKQVETMTTTLAPLGEPVVKAAKEAADILKQKVPQEMNQARNELAASQEKKAAEPQKKAQEGLQQARQALDNLAMQVAQAQMQSQGLAAMTPEEAAQASQELTEALQSQLEALQLAQAAAQGQPSQQEQGPPGQKGQQPPTPSQAMAQAAEALGMASNKMAAMIAAMPMPGMEPGESLEGMKGPADNGAANQGRIRSADPRLMGRRQWNLIFENVTGDVRQSEADRMPSEYRELVRQYFDRIGQNDTMPTP